MSKYYCLIAGLPDVSLDDTKLTYSVSEFKEELDSALSKRDSKLVRWIFLKYDNANLLSYLRNASVGEFDSRGVFSEEDIKYICDLVKDEQKVPKAMSVPAYFVEFIKEYYARLEDSEAKEHHILWEDRLSSLYYNEAIACKNSFLSSWFELNLNIGNVMTAQNCREYGLDKEAYIVGDNRVAKKLRRPNARDFGIDDSFEYIAELMQIAEDKDFFMRERRLDALRWNWLEETILYKTFDIVSVVAYLLRLGMIERWVGLNKVSGEKTFRSLVVNMKRGSSEALDKFKENNK